MSPKKQAAKPKAKAPAAALAAPAVAGVSMTAGVAENLNNDYYQEVNDAIDCILQHPDFSDIQTCDPVGIDANAKAEDAGNKAGLQGIKVAK